jgi:1,4-dihydroxy-2-naphthoate octaprenyltransferase
MRALERRVALGLAGRGDIDDVVRWTRRARDAGLDGIWVHDTPYERDGITYGTVVARTLAQEGAGAMRVGIGAVNPFTRHPLVLAMTGSGLDEILPERISMGIGTGMPIRLAQMGIPYSQAEGVARVDSTLDQLRILWAGERLPSATAGFAPIQPMFPPVHRIPLFVAGYRKELVELAGRKGDGYLARPCESIPSLGGILERLRASAVAAGRNPDDIETAGYLLSLVDKTRREALNRAKREPFVIYMMSILGDVSLRRAGFPVEMRDRISAAWRADDFHEAGKLIPDDLLDAFMLCGTREDVAAGAMAFHAQTGLDVPVLQPVVQEDRYVYDVIEAARLYAHLPVPAGSLVAERAAEGGLPSGLPAPGRPAPVSVATGVSTIPQATTVLAFETPAGEAAYERTDSLADDRRLGPVERVRRRVAAGWEIVRPFAYTVSVIPVLAGAALAAVDGRFEWLPLLASLSSAMLIQSGTNVVNEVFDVRRGIDTITSPRASRAVLKGRISEAGAQAFSYGLFALGVAIGMYLVFLRGPAMLVLGLVGFLGGYQYTAPPLQYKYRALGVPLVFLLMGPLTVGGSYFAVSGTWDPRTLVLSLPVGLLVAAIVHGNDWRDIGDDTRAGIVTISSWFGREWAHYGYLALVLGAYVSLGVSVAARWLPPTTTIALLSLPLLAQVVHSAEFGAAGQARAIAKIDLETARLHLAFGLLLIAGLLLSNLRPM